MNIDPKRLGLAAFGVLALAGCAVDPHTGEIIPPPHELGEASQQTFMAQVVDPDPHYREPMPETSGVETERAIEALREGKVEEPNAPNPTVSISGSGGGGSGSR